MARLLLASALVSLCGAIAAHGKAPHVVLLVLDDIGWADVGFHGSDFPTPNIDNLAKTGVQLERMYVMPQCSPTRAAIMTGRYSFRTGLQHFSTIVPGATPGIPDDSHTIAQTFRAAGYSTHMVGKWHLGYSKWSQTPMGKGFESYYGYLQGQTDYYNRTIASCSRDFGCPYRINRWSRSHFGDGAAGYDFWDNKTIIHEDFGKYTVDAYEARVERLLRPYGSVNPPSQPLFLYFAEQQLHIPLEAPPEPEYLEACRGVQGGSGLVNRTLLCSMAGRLDRSVARLVEMLKANKMWENTLLLAMSDNGGMNYFADKWPASASSNFPLRGGKTTLFEGGVRAVAFVNGGALPAAARGSSRTQLMHAVDVLPTLAGFAGVPLLGGGAPVDGLDAWAAIAEDAPMNRTELPLNIGINPLGSLPWFVPGIKSGGGLNYSALISWPWKVMMGEPYIEIIVKDDRRRDGWWGVQGYEYKAPPDEKNLPFRLYNLEQDETEQFNLADRPEHQSLMERLVARIKFYANKENGWVPPQNNVPRPRGNPRFHNWTWAPFMKDEAGDEEGEMEEDHEVALVV